MLTHPSLRALFHSFQRSFLPCFILQTKDYSFKRTSTSETQVTISFGQMHILATPLHPHSWCPRPIAKFSHPEVSFLLLNLLSSDSESRSLASGLWPLSSLSPFFNPRLGKNQEEEWRSFSRRCVKNWALFPNEWRGRGRGRGRDGGGGMEGAPYCHDIPAGLSDA